MRLTEREIVAVLRHHHYKITPQRRAVIQTITAVTSHVTPTAIHERTHREHPNIGLVTIYRTLEILARLKLICELHAGDNCPSYTIGTPEHHHHLICSGCGQVIDFTRHDLTKLERDLSAETGFEIKSHVLDFTGFCGSCQKQKHRTT
ncbi:MAG: Fur family transcriptional regulator [Dehalococcoidales bacterium]|nr:Fur family transcriptional regulator [Dehalococcoidales bacterium]